LSTDLRANVVIYTTAYCGYCHAAKRLLDNKGVAYQEVACDRRPELRSWLLDATQQRTVPQIFINGESIGGFSELSALERGGRLDGKLATRPSVDNRSLPS
jgi:glutaredoxin 3